VPPKLKIPAPIDRPISRAYLRQFTGWSTAYPPGMSDSTSLRIMENVMVNRDASVRVRPGLRHMSWQAEPDGTLLASTNKIVGTHEPFFLNDGSKAYLFAVREASGTVGFRVLARPGGAGQLTIHPITDPGISFLVPEGMATLEFSAKTTYVKYLQIDNKIFALSNAGEPMRIFQVGVNKSAKALRAIVRPEWTTDDKLTVVHPTAAWVNGALPTDTRRNKFLSPNFDVIAPNWAVSATTSMVRSSTIFRTGPYAGRMTSLPTRTNIMPRPLHSTAPITLAGWSDGSGASSISIAGNALRVNIPSGAKGRRGYANSPACDATALVTYQISLDIVDAAGVGDIGMKVRFYTTGGAQIGEDLNRSLTSTPGRRVTSGVAAPKGTATMRIFVYGEVGGTAAQNFSFNNVLICENTEPNTMFSGTSGTNYFWTGASNNSASVYHPPVDISVTTPVDPVTERSWCASLYIQSVTSRQATLSIAWKGGDSGNTATGSTPGVATATTVGSFARLVTTDTAPVGSTNAKVTLKIAAVPRGEYHYIDDALFETGGSAAAFFSGATADSDTLKHSWDGDANDSSSTEKIFTAAGPLPPAATKTAQTLISSTAASNSFSFGFFYTFSNEIGECAASQITVVRAQRGWSMWKWETPNAAAEPSGTATADPGACADQLVAYMSNDVFKAARDQGATHWSLYMFTWSDQQPVPVNAVRVAEREITRGSTYNDNAWLRATPQLSDTGDDLVPLPKGNPRINYSDPSCGGQGIVAADRMVLVNDPTAQAVIRWTSNSQGSYTDFSAVRGGGFKTLTSGNLYIPGTVKLWQNPQSVDTLTILCVGVDGQSTSYYMQPAQVAAQSEAVNIMGFE
jgi:hypothetical protein